MAKTVSKTKLKESKFLSSPMLDGLKLGIQIGDEIPDIVEFRRQIEDSDLPLFTGPKLLGFKLKGRSTLKITFNYWKNRYYFNVEGNPISFLYGGNQVGTVHLLDLVNQMFNHIELLLEKKHNIRFPQTLKRCVQSKNIYIYGMSFALYTNPMALSANDGTSSQLISCLSHFYQFVDIDTDNVYRIEDELGVNLVQDGQTSLRFERKSGANFYWSLGIYDKGEEQRARGKPVLPSVVNRLRLDLTLKSHWFCKNRLRTLDDICAKHGDDYEFWVYSLFAKILTDLRLHYIAKFTTLDRPINCGNYKKAYGMYKKGHPMGKKAIEFFLKQGYDFSLSYRFHRVAKLAYFSLGLPLNIKHALLDNPKKAAVLMEDWLQKPKVNTAFHTILEILQSLEIDTDFPKYRPSEI